MSLTKIKFNNFTAFKSLDVELSPGINIFIGANGTGKTHILKAAYVACDIIITKFNFADKLIRVFLPSGHQLGRLVYRQRGMVGAKFEIFNDNIKIAATFSNHAVKSDQAKIIGIEAWNKQEIRSVYIPVKEMLANAPKFRSLYNLREIHFEEVYADIIDRAYLPLPRGPMEKQRKKLMTVLQKAIDGKVRIHGEEFFLSNKQGELEFTLLAEGMRKLALLWLLIQNGTLLEGSVLCWDEPESNLNPKVTRTLVEILLELQRLGVQILIATHDYVILKEFDLQRKKEDKVKFHSLFRDEITRQIMLKSTDSYLDIHPNSIADTFSDLYDRDVQRALTKS